jgi:hypothetical protein
MSLPSAVLLDTSVLAGQQYNFGSVAMSSFVPAAAAKKIVLLLPAPTEQEILNQIDERSKEALQALETAKRKAPFLEKWEHFPKVRPDAASSWQVTRHAQKEWRAFLKRFELQRLGYEGVNLAEIMKWYGQILPPFREGKKRKEFPDAFSIAIVSDWAKKHATAVAVVSEDSDFQLACERFPSLLYFRSLPELTELLLTPDGDVTALRAAVLSSTDALDEAILEAARELPAIHDDFEYDIVESEILTAHSIDVRIVAIGRRECTLVFEAAVEGQYDLKWTGYDHERDEESEEQGTIIESFHVSGTAKAQLDAKTSSISAITYVSINDNFLEVTEQLRHRW